VSIPSEDFSPIESDQNGHHIKQIGRAKESYVGCLSQVLKHLIPDTNHSAQTKILPTTNDTDFENMIKEQPCKTF